MGGMNWVRKKNTVGIHIARLELGGKECLGRSLTYKINNKGQGWNPVEQ